MTTDRVEKEMTNEIETELVGLVAAKDGTVERVALDLMQIIANAESKQLQGQEHPREYYLRLYSKCLQAVILRNYQG